MVMFGLSHSFVLSMIALVASGACDNISVVIRLSLEQLLTPERLRGRVSAVHYVFIGTSNELPRELRIGRDRGVVRGLSRRWSAASSARCSWLLPP